MGENYIASQGIRNIGPVSPELLRSELTGEIEDSDYYAKSTICLQDFIPQLDNIENFTSADAIAFEDIAQLSEPGYQKMENGYVRLPDGSLYIAVLSDLGVEITGQMFDWWISNCDNDEKFKWWHPVDHLKLTWDDSFYGAMAFERPLGHYVDHTMTFDCNFGETIQTMHMEFLRPSRYFDTADFAEQNITACLVARLHIKDPVYGMIAIGHAMHMVRETNGRSELRSRFWLGDIAVQETPNNYLYAKTTNYISKLYLFRLLKLPSNYGRLIFLQCAQKMSCLKEFLPHYYNSSIQQQSEFIEQFNFGSSNN